MRVEIKSELLPSVAKEIEKLNLDEESALRLRARIDMVNEKQNLEEFLQTQYISKMKKRKVFYKDNKIGVYELRIDKEKGKNLRVLLCGIEEKGGVRVDVLFLYITKVWKKKTKKIPNEYIDLAIRRFKSFLKTMEG